MLTVNELATQNKAPVRVARYYARIGLIQPAAKQENGYRLFSSQDATRIRFIRMDQALEQWKHRRNGIPNGHSVCHLIESVESEEENETLQAVG